MWTILKVFIIYVTILLLFHVLIFWPQSTWDLSSPTRGWTCASCIRRWSLNHQTTREVPISMFWLYFLLAIEPFTELWFLFILFFDFFGINTVSYLPFFPASPSFPFCLSSLRSLQAFCSNLDWMLSGFPLASSPQYTRPQIVSFLQRSSVLLSAEWEQ